MKKIIFIVVMLSCISYQCFSQRRDPQTPVPSAPVYPPNTNTLNRPVANLPVGPKPYRQVITDKAKTDVGLFKVHNVEDRYFFEIPDTLLGREILAVNRISKAAADNRASMMGYGGDQIGNNIIRFEKGPSNKIYIRSISYRERSSDTTQQGMYRSVMNSNLQPLVTAFDIKAFAKDSVSGVKGSVIDVTDYLNGDNDIFFFSGSAKKALSLGVQMADRSYIKEIRSYPLNIEIGTLKTYTKTPTQLPGLASNAGGNLSPVTYELNSSMVLLPLAQMNSRMADPRLGYFTTGYVDFDADPQGVKNQALITRWRLEPKPEDIEKYKRGELVEPKKQIIYYIDPATPKKWVPYLIQGVNDWQVAFEKAGFKNAIIAKEAPKDPTWNIDDARHSVIVYKPSEIANASGPNVHDPRTGEILETHISWYHNIMQLLKNWYFIQASAIDPRARNMEFDDKLMGDLIRFVSSHEVGHTLGLRHNFGSSATVPVEKLRDKIWLEKNGHTPSIMDYARFNYVAQPEDHISASGIFPRIGDYDKWAIEWGYRWRPQFDTFQEEVASSNQTIIKRVGENKRLAFGSEGDPNDPRNQSEDLGDNAMVASSYGIKNLKRILPNILSWSKEPNESYQNAKMLYIELIGQYNRYMGHVAKNIGGIYTSYKTIEEKGGMFYAVPYLKQKEAMSFLNAQLFTTPMWLIDKDLIDRTGISATELFSGVQKNTLAKLLNVTTIGRLIDDEALNGEKAYTAINLLSDLKAGIWMELTAHQKIDVYRRNLQKAYVDNIKKLISSSVPPTGIAGGPSMSRYNPTSSDISSICRAHLSQLGKNINSAIPFATGVTKYHLQDLLIRINSALDVKSQD